MNLKKSVVAVACGLGAVCVLFASTLVAQGGPIISYKQNGYNVPVPPKGQAYLGAAINDPSLCPLNSSSVPQCSSDFNTAITQMTDAFETSSNFNRTLAVHMLYYNFDDIFATSSTWSLAQDPRLSDDFSHGRIPIISWNCTGSNTTINTDSNATTNNNKTTVYYTTEDVANGRWDWIIRQAAQNLQKLGRPVFLRYFWEMNIATGKNNICENQSSLSVPEMESYYVQAFQRIVNIFRQVGADNVSFIWSTWAGTAYSHYYDAQYPDGVNFYPGATYVDWIGVDIYDPTQDTSQDFSTVMNSSFAGQDPYGTQTTGSPVYATYTDPYTYGYFIWNGTQWIPWTPPLMISETGALNGTPEQAEYVNTMTDISSQFPRVRAISYFNKNDIKNWLLGTGSTDTGIAAFTKLGGTEGFKCWYNNSQGETNCW